MRWLPRLRGLGQLARALRREEGSATIEFVIIFPIFVAILASSIEVSILSTRQVMLERGLDITVRDLRLGRLPAPSHDTVRAAICEQTFMIPDCNDNLLLNLRPINTTTWAGLDAPLECLDRDDVLRPVTEMDFASGEANELMLVHVCALAQPLFPGTALVAALRKDASGAYLFSSTSAFVNEPTVK